MKHEISRIAIGLLPWVLLLGPFAAGAAVAQSTEAGLIRRHADAVPRESCFPLESLPEPSRDLSRKLLLEALDSEALYTLVGDLKPISEGFFDTWFEVEPADASELSETRRAISAWQCGKHYSTGVLPFQFLRGGRRFASGWIASQPALAAKFQQHDEFFARLGMTPESTAEAVLLRIDGARDIAERWRGFGLVFGYPEWAVEFFVRAGTHYQNTGEFIERDFRNYPTHDRKTGGFVYAVPKLEPESAAEKLLRRKVDAILTVYRGLRAKYIVDDQPERVVELIRDWFDDGTGWCHPDHAMQKALAWDEARQWVENRGIQLKTVLPTEPLEDLRPLDRILKDRRIVALGESTHGTREFFQWKHRLFRHLVENHDVRLFGIEASYAACLPIDEYVRTGQGDPRTAIKNQGFWTWDTEEVLELVEWMREWNEQRPAGTEPVRFHGFDTQDACTPLKLVLEKLQRHFPEKTSAFRKRLTIALQKQYGQALHGAQRDQLEHLLATIGELQESCETPSTFSPQTLRAIRLLLKQARAAIRIELVQRDQWSSRGMDQELALYSRIRARLPGLISQIGNLPGAPSQTLMEFVKAAEDLKRCQLRFRDELHEEQRQAWRDAVQWGRENADSRELQELLEDLQEFLAVSTEYLGKPKRLVNARDEAMAGFVTDILELHGAQSRIVLWAHDWHISKFDGNPVEDMPRMGTFLERTYGDDYLPIGLSFGAGKFQAKYFPEEDEDPAKMVLREFQVDGSRPDSFSHLFDYNSAPVSAYLLNESFSSDVPDWFSQPHVNRILGAAYQPRLEDSDSYYEELILPQHFEIVLHVRKTERSRPLSPVPRFRLGAEFTDVEVTHINQEDPTQRAAEGVLVESVSAGSLAERCGLQARDRIVQVGEHEIATPSGLLQVLAAIDRPGSHEMTVWRKGGSNDGTAPEKKLALYLIVPPWIVE